MKKVAFQEESSPSNDKLNIRHETENNNSEIITLENVLEMFNDLVEQSQIESPNLSENSKKFMIALQRLMKNILESWSKHTLLESDRYQCFELLVNIFAYPDLFSNDDISTVQSWIHQLEEEIKP